LGELGVFENIGEDKKIVEGQKKVMLLNFMDIMRNKHINKKVLSMEVSASDSKIEKCDIKKHDVFITPTSETRDEIGFAAVVEEDIPNAVYSYHIMRYRLRKKNDVTPYFISYLFEENSLRTQIFKASKGLTRFGLSGKDFGKLLIPIPPLPIQQEIVAILDKFTALEVELEVELEARRAQYEYYRNQLLTPIDVNGKWLMNGKEVERKMLGEVSKILRGTAITEKETISGEFPVVANSPNPIYFHGNSNRSGETIVIARSGAYSGLVSYWDKPFFLTDAFSIHPDNTLFKTKFLYFLLKREQEKIHQMKKGSGVPHVRAKDFESYSVPIPPLSEQELIVEILDKFDALVNDISVGLPAEIQARRKQYEYYRGKLLDFKPLNH